MKQCGSCLLLGNVRVYDIRQLREHFDTDMITGYLLAGVLESWLYEADEQEILSRVRKIDLKGDIGAQLEFIFGVRPEKKERPAEKINESIRKALEARKASEAAESGNTGSGGSFGRGSFTVGSFNIGINSAAGSFGFYKSSFSIGSGYGMGLGYGRGYSSGLGYYGLGSGLWFLRRYGFGLGSGISFGSGQGYGSGLGLWKGLRFSGSYNLGSGGSFSGMNYGSFSGSFRYYAGNTEITEEEYHRTLINLSSCPLNEYGYGIHLV